MRLYIVRHGDKEYGDYYNVELRHQDSPLSEIGDIRAKELVNYFKCKDIKKIIVSEYIRTEMTAKYVSENKKLQIQRDKRLNKIDNGIIDSLEEEEIKMKYLVFWKKFFSYSIDARFSGGETGNEVKQRQKELLDELIKNNEEVLLISHEGYIRLLMCHLLGIPTYNRNLFKVDMCGIMEIDYTQKTKSWKIIKFNHTLYT